MRSAHPETRSCKVALTCLALAALPACASSGVQVPKSKPHAVAELRVTHSGKVDRRKVSDAAVLDGISFDLDQQGPLSVRLAPGDHELVLKSSRVEYHHQIVRREVPQYCSLPNCSANMLPLYEDAMVLVPEEITACSRTLHLKVAAGDTVRETLLVDTAGKCLPAAI